MIRGGVVCKLHGIGGLGMGGFGDGLAAQLPPQEVRGHVTGSLNEGNPRVYPWLDKAQATLHINYISSPPDLAARSPVGFIILGG